jgi:hypothetical protein
MRGGSGPETGAVKRRSRETSDGVFRWRRRRVAAVVAIGIASR